LNSLRTCSRPCMALTVSAVRLHATLPTQSFRCADQFHNTTHRPTLPFAMHGVPSDRRWWWWWHTDVSYSGAAIITWISASIHAVRRYARTCTSHRADRRAGCLHHKSSYIAVSRAVGMVTVPVHVTVRVLSLSLELTEHPCCAHSHRTVIVSLFCLEVVPRWHTTRRGRLFRCADCSTARRAWGGASGLFGTP